MSRNATSRRWKTLEDLIHGPDLSDDDFGAMSVRRKREFAALRKRIGPTDDLGSERDYAESTDRSVGPSP